MDSKIVLMHFDGTGEGSRGGHVIGHTGGGKPIYSAKKSLNTSKIHTEIYKKPGGSPQTLGFTKSGKQVFVNSEHPKHKELTSREHTEAARMHEESAHGKRPTELSKQEHVTHATKHRDEADKAATKEHKNTKDVMRTSDVGVDIGHGYKVHKGRSGGEGAYSVSKNGSAPKDVALSGGAGSVYDLHTLASPTTKHEVSKIKAHAENMKF